MITESTVSVVSWTSSYSLPVNFHDVTANWTGLFTVDWDSNITNKELTITQRWSSRNWYILNWSNIILTPAPTSTYTLKLRYTPKLAKLTAMGNTIFIDEEYSEYVTEAFNALYLAWVKLWSDEAFSDQRFVRALDELLDNYRRVPYVIDQEDVTNYYS